MVLSIRREIGHAWTLNDNDVLAGRQHVHITHSLRREMTWVARHLHLIMLLLVIF